MRSPMPLTWILGTEVPLRTAECRYQTSSGHFDVPRAYPRTVEYVTEKPKTCSFCDVPVFRIDASSDSGVPSALVTVNVPLYESAPLLRYRYNPAIENSSLGT